MSRKKKVVLFFPSYNSDEAAPPLALIAIAGPLVQQGYDIKIVDTAIEEDYVAAVMAELEDALCLGISLITGPMIKGAVDVGRAAKARYPDLPIVLGGWHPSILPEQTLAADFADVVVLKQGEMAFAELLTCFENDASLDHVTGILWKRDGEMVRNKPRNYPKVAALPSRLPGYDLIDYDRYFALTGLRWLMYSTSHGCPYNCGYCSNASVYGRNLDHLPVEQVVEEVTYLIKTYGITLLGIIDDIYFAFRERSLQMAEGFVRSGLKFEWYIQDRADSWARLSLEEAKLFRRSGLVRIHFGAESGSDEVLASIEKKATIEKTLDAVERCDSAGIRASFGFIFGLPEEEQEDLYQTVDLIDRIYSGSDIADCYTNIFTPYPGSPLWPIALSKGFQAPASFEEWSNYYPRVTELPWISGEKHRQLQAIRQYLRFGYHQVKVGEKRHSWKHSLLLSMLKPTSRYRIRSKNFKFPVEIYSYWGLQKLKHGFDIYQRY